MKDKNERHKRTEKKKEKGKLSKYKKIQKQILRIIIAWVYDAVSYTHLTLPTICSV